MKSITIIPIITLLILSICLSTHNLFAAGPICTEAFKNAQSENTDDLKGIDLCTKCIFDEGLGCNFQYSAAYHNRGGHYFHLKKFDEAIADLNKSIELLPADQKISYKYLEAHYKLRAKIYKAMGKIKEAKSDEANEIKYKKLQ